MGLDICAYSKLELFEEWDQEKYEYEQYDYERLTPITPSELRETENAFPGRSDGLTAGFYKFDKTTHFRAGSYSGYNRWREWLAKTMLGVTPETVWENYSDWEGKPFAELINFFDSNGIIGPHTSKRLFDAFESHRDKAGAEQTYMDFHEAFRMAANGGCVMFC